jgi:hypothetical protein
MWRECKDKNRMTSKKKSENHFTITTNSPILKELLRGFDAPYEPMW